MYVWRVCTWSVYVFAAIPVVIKCPSTTIHIITVTRSYDFVYVFARPTRGSFDSASRLYTVDNESTRFPREYRRPASFDTGAFCMYPCMYIYIFFFFFFSLDLINRIMRGTEGPGYSFIYRLLSSTSFSSPNFLLTEKNA